VLGLWKNYFAVRKKLLRKKADFLKNILYYFLLLKRRGSLHRSPIGIKRLGFGELIATTLPFPFSRVRGLKRLTNR